MPPGLFIIDRFAGINIVICIYLLKLRQSPIRRLRQLFNLCFAILEIVAFLLRLCQIAACFPQVLVCRFLRLAVLPLCFRAFQIAAGRIPFLSLRVFYDILTKSLYPVFIHLQTVRIYPAHLLHAVPICCRFRFVRAVRFLPVHPLRRPHHFHFVTVHAAIHDYVMMYPFQLLPVL